MLSDHCALCARCPLRAPGIAKGPSTDPAVQNRLSFRLANVQICQRPLGKNVQMRYVAYLRVSTTRQGLSDLGLDAQEASIRSFARGRNGEILATYVEVESGSVNLRPELLRALSHCKLTGAALVITKLYKLSSNPAFLLTLQGSGARFLAADMPDANELTVGVMALVAQQKRQAISKRTKEALAVAKVRGRKLGNPNRAAALHKAGKGNAAPWLLLLQRLMHVQRSYAR